MFGIGRGDERNIGFSRIFEAMGTDMYLSCLELDVETKGILGFHVSLKRWITGIALFPKS